MVEELEKEEGIANCTYYIKCNLCGYMSKAFSITHQIDMMERWKCFNCDERGSLECYYIKLNRYQCKSCGREIDGHNNIFHGGLCDNCEDEIMNEGV